MQALRQLTAGQVAASVAAYVVAAAGAYVVFAKPPVVDVQATASREGRRATFNANAARYDDEVDGHERWSGIAGLRRELCARAAGAVVEVAAGTGRNLSYYAPEARLLLLDNAEDMLGAARAKAAALPASRPGGAVQLAVADVTHLTLPPASADTVVDTFSLCSFDDPAAALREMVRVLKPGGHLLLLEHGRSSWAPLNWFLDKYTPAHVARHGCAWNRDISALLATLPGMRVVEARRTHLGTTYLWDGVKLDSETPSTSAATAAMQ